MVSHARHIEKPRGGWVKLTPAEVKAFSPQNKQAIKLRVDKVIDRHMKPLVLKRRGGKATFGDVQDIYTKWRGNDLILIAKRRGGRVSGRYAEDFETKSGRLTLVGVDKFAVSYFRHTGRWWTIAYDCSLKTALMFFRTAGPVWPW
jgi:hypothetical protein